MSILLPPRDTCLPLCNLSKGNITHLRVFANQWVLLHSLIAFFWRVFVRICVQEGNGLHRGPQPLEKTRCSFLCQLLCDSALKCEQLKHKVMCLIFRCFTNIKLEKPRVRNLCLEIIIPSTLLQGTKSRGLSQFLVVICYYKVKNEEKTEDLGK